MSVPSISRSCLGTSLPRATRTVSSSWRQTASRASQRRELHPRPAPLFLDFLAPSWQSHPGRRSRIPSQTVRKSPSSLASRSFSSTPIRDAVAIKNARKDDSGNDMLITITPRAAHRLQAIAETDANPDLALRVAVESGGCHGFQYLMSLTNTADADPEEDTIFENEERVNKKGAAEGDGYRAKVIMDEPSLELLKGSSVDYTMELIGSQFKVTGIPGAKSSCGCGTSFDIAT